MAGMAAVKQDAVAAKAQKKQKFEIFRAKDAQDVDGEMMPHVGLKQADLDGIALATEAGVGEGAVVRSVFSSDEVGLSLTYAWFKPHYPLPRHSHDADCAYYVISGEAHMGTEVLKAGDSFYVPSDTLYQYVAGPEGVEILECRTAASFHINFSGNANFWGKMAKASAGNLAGWREIEAPVAVRRFLGQEA